MQAVVWCHFAMCTPKSQTIQTISADPVFCAHGLYVQFYKCAVLPKLILPRYSAAQPIREPFLWLYVLCNHRSYNVLWLAHAHYICMTFLHIWHMLQPGLHYFTWIFSCALVTSICIILCYGLSFCLFQDSGPLAKCGLSSFAGLLLHSWLFDELRTKAYVGQCSVGCCMCKHWCDLPGRDIIAWYDIS